MNHFFSWSQYLRLTGKKIDTWIYDQVICGLLTWLKYGKVRHR